MCRSCVSQLGKEQKTKTSRNTRILMSKTQTMKYDDKISLTRKVFRKICHKVCDNNEIELCQILPGIFKQYFRTVSTPKNILQQWLLHCNAAWIYLDNYSLLHDYPKMYTILQHYLYIRLTNFTPFLWCFMSCYVVLWSVGHLYY